MRNRHIKTKKIKQRNYKVKKRNSKVGGDGKVKRTLKKIKKKMSGSLKYVSGKMKKIFKNISKKIKISDYEGYFLRLKKENPEKFEKINKVANFKFEQLKKGDKKTIKVIEELTSHPESDNHIAKMHGGFGKKCSVDEETGWDVCEYTTKSIVEDILAIPIQILIYAAIMAIIKWKCWKGTMNSNTCDRLSRP